MTIIIKPILPDKRPLRGQYPTLKYSASHSLPREHDK